MRRTKITPPTADDFELATKVAAWMAELAETEQKNDYLHNLSVYGKAGMVNEKGIGIVASAIVAYQREVAKREAATERGPVVSKHIGSVGERLTLKVRLAGVFSSMNDFGASWIHKFEIVEGEHAGARLTWFSSGRAGRTETEGDDAGRYVCFEPGDVFWVKATVKRHGEYKNVKETTITRATVIDDPATEKLKKKAAKRSEVPAGVLSVDGVDYPAFDIVRADGQVAGWCVREPSKGKKPGKQIDKSEGGRRFSEDVAWHGSAISTIRQANIRRAREAFGLVKVIETYKAVDYSDSYKTRYPNGDWTRPQAYHYWQGASKRIVQVATNEFQIWEEHQGVADKALGFSSFEEAKAELDRSFINHSYRFEKVGP